MPVQKHDYFKYRFLPRCRNPGEARAKTHGRLQPPVAGEEGTSLTGSMPKQTGERRDRRGPLVSPPVLPLAVSFEFSQGHC